MKDRIFVSSGIACCVIFSQIEMKWWWSVIKNKIYMDKRRHGLTRGEEGLKNLVIGSELHPTDWTDFRHSISMCRTPVPPSHFFRLSHFGTAVGSHGSQRLSRRVPFQGALTAARDVADWLSPKSAAETIASCPARH